MSEAERKELETLREWRAKVTAALGRPGGAFYADVPSHICEMRREIDSLKFRLALVGSPTRLDGVAEYDITNDPRD